MSIHVTALVAHLQRRENSEILNVLFKRISAKIDNLKKSVCPYTLENQTYDLHEVVIGRQGGNSEISVMGAVINLKGLSYDLNWFRGNKQTIIGRGNIIENKIKWK